MLSYPSSLTGFNNETVNDLFLPGIGAKYYIFIKTPGSAHNEYANLGLYFDGRVYKNIPNTELTDFSFSSAGAAKNLAVGLHVGLLIGSLNLELGNRWIPVRINNEPSTKNFGGIYAEMSGVIYLFNYSGIKEKFKR
jgi:hypothetical protein